MVSTPEREEPSPSSCRILFVDDNESLRAIIPETLRDAGYIVATADGGKSCLDELCQAEYDLIILDIMMEPMDGWKTLRAIRKDTAYQEIPIVILTGKLFLPAEMITYGTEVAGWIKKPIHMEQFTARIDEIVADLIEDQRIAEEKAAAG
ncbi:MAG: response regulator, partial [Methanocalculus sp. MSAO_Arc1]|uniref:response regulator n=1 Tax=Methanocalculus sp. MSAO_Arc1 TaxID=2293854 RepID=UPI000FF8064F